MPLSEPIDATLHHIATGVGAFVEVERTSRSCRSLHSLISLLWNRVLDLPLAEAPDDEGAREGTDKPPPDEGEGA